MTSPQSARVPDRLPYLRWLCLFVLIVAEFIAISLRYDARTVGIDRALHGLIMHAGTAARLGIAVVLATFMVIGPHCFGMLKQSASRLRRFPGFIPALAGNLLAFLCFYGLSGLVLEGPPSRYSDHALVAAWVISGLITLILWSLAVLPIDLWGALLRGSGSNLLVGPALGVTAFLCALFAGDQWKTLSRVTLRLVVFLLTRLFPDAFFEPDKFLVGTPAFSVKVAPVCSGYEGMGLIGALLAVYLWAFRSDLRFPRALVLLPLGMGLIWLANAFRIAILVAIGTLGYPEIALGGFHSLAGWVFFLLIGLGLVALSRRSSFFSSIQSSEADSAVDTPGLDGAYLVPAMAIIATAMVTTSFWPGFDRYYPVRVIAATLALLFYRKSYAELRLRWSWEAFAIGIAVYIFWMALEPLKSSPSSGEPLRASLESLGPIWSIVWLVFRVVGSVVTVPIAEELAFRGYLTRRLITADFESIPPGRMTWWSLLLSSIVFGALHGRWFAGTLAGIAYAFAYRRRGELTDAVVAHGVTNGLIAITVLATGAWSLWS